MSKRYQRRTHTVTAEQFIASAEVWPDTVTKDSHGWFYVATKSGPIRIEDGDFIVQHEDGLKLRIRPAIFRHMYVEVA